MEACLKGEAIINVTDELPVHLALFSMVMEHINFPSWQKGSNSSRAVTITTTSDDDHHHDSFCQFCY